MEETFRQRKPVTPEEVINIPQSAPPQLQAMLQKAKQQEKQQEEETVPSGPRLAFTGNAKLDELLAGIKETVYKYEEVMFPSMGKFYDGTVAPSDGIIHVRGMTGEEDQIFATSRYVKSGQAINMIFKNCVRENIMPDNLLLADRTWLLIYLRGISHGTDYEVDVRCVECNTRFPTVIDLDSLMVKRCPSDFGPDKLRDVLPKTKYKFSYRLATGKDENMIQNYRERRMKQSSDSQDDTMTYRASLLVTDIEGLNEQSALQQLILKLPIQDVSYIRSILVEPPFGVDTKSDVLCPNCGEGFKVDLPIDVNFFYPKPKKAMT